MGRKPKSTVVDNVDLDKIDTQEESEGTEKEKQYIYIDDKLRLESYTRGWTVQEYKKVKSKKDNSVSWQWLDGGDGKGGYYGSIPQAIFGAYMLRINKPVAKDLKELIDYVKSIQKQFQVFFMDDIGTFAKMVDESKVKKGLRK